MQSWRRMLLDLLLIGKRVIVSFPNFGPYRARLRILFTGQTPVPDQLPYEWYNSPNIRVITSGISSGFSVPSGYVWFEKRATYGIIMFEQLL
jgi:methionine biosynthesis protein MetW